jgi:hypothetical protein
LRAKLPTPGREEDTGEANPEDARDRGSAPTCCSQGQSEGPYEENHVQKHRQAETADANELVKHQLGEPLLVDPMNAMGEHGQRLVLRDPVRGNLAAADECQPAVLYELERRETREQDAVEREQHQRQAFGIECAEKSLLQPGAASRRRHVADIVSQPSEP